VDSYPIFEVTGSAIVVTITAPIASIDLFGAGIVLNYHFCLWADNL